MSEKLYTVSRKSRSVSNRLLLDIQRRSSLNRVYERQSLALKKKLVDERKLAYNAIGGGASKEEGGGLLGAVVQNLLLFRLFKGGFGFGGGGRGRRGPRVPPTPTLGPGGSPPKPSRITPRNNIVPFTRGRVPSTLSRVGPLAVLGTGLDFTSRLGSGQNVLQASLGAGGGLAGALAGGAKGAALGSFAGPIGTLIGGVGGSLIGAIAGGSIADLLSGANRRRSIEQERVERTFAVTEFSKAQDDFDQVLDKFEGNTAPMLKAMKSEPEEAPSTGAVFPTPPAKPKFWTAGRIFDTVLFAGELLLFAAAVLSPFEGVAGDIGAGALLSRRLAKIFGKNAIKNFSRKGFSVPRSVMLRRGIRSTPRVTVGSGKVIKNISNKSITERISRAVERGNFPKQSRVGIIKRQGANELLMTRIDNLLNSIRGKGIKTTPLRFDKPFVTRRGVGPKGNLVDRTQKLLFGRQSYKNNVDGESFRLTTSILKDGKKVLQTENVPISGFSEAFKNKQFIKNLKEGERLKNIIQSGGPKNLPPNSNPIKKVFQKPVNTKPIEKLQEGGRVEAGKPYIVGEIGKELFVPDASGDILPNEDLGASRLVIINREPNTVIAPYVVNTSPPPKVVSTSDPYDIVAKYAQMTGLLTV